MCIRDSRVEHVVVRAPDLVRRELVDQRHRPVLRPPARKLRVLAKALQRAAHHFPVPVRRFRVKGSIN
eukprot:11400309-Alexandrium_andersonii.AAC.1